MSAKTIRVIETMDFSFENTLTRIVANRNHPEITLAGLTVGPFEEGNEYETYNWVAQELEKSGIAHLRENENLTTRINKIQWTERVQTAGQISKLPDDFYPKLRRCLAELKKESAKAPEKMLEYEKVRHLTRDIVNSRLRKIVSIASAPAQTEQALRNFTAEERFLYEQLHTFISGWRTKILEREVEEE